MTANSAWGLVIAALVVLVGWIGQPLGDALVKEGKLPDWISPKLAGFFAWLSADVPVPVWLLILVGCCLSVAVALFLKYHTRRSVGVPSSLAHVTSLLEASQQRNLDLDASNILLHQQLSEASASLQALQEKTFDVSPQGNRVLAIVASCTDQGGKATLSWIAE